MDLKRLYGPGPHGNGLRWHAEILLAKKSMDTLTPEDVVEYYKQVEACMAEPGLLRRGPWYKSDQEGPDDYVATVSCLRTLNSGLQDQIYKYGRTHLTPLLGVFLQKWGEKWWALLLEVIFGWVKVKGNFNNVAPEAIHPSSWLWRQPQVYAHMALAAGAQPPWFTHLWWCLVVATSGRKSTPEASNFDTWALAWHLVNVGQEYSLFTKWASKIFLWRFRRQYPAMMADVSWAYREGLV